MPEAGVVNDDYAKRSSCGDIVGDVVNLTNLPSRVFKPNKEASFIDLEGGPPRRVMAVGRRTLLTATAVDNGHSKANVTWCALHSDMAKVPTQIGGSFCCKTSIQTIIVLRPKTCWTFA